MSDAEHSLESRFRNLLVAVASLSVFAAGMVYYALYPSPFPVDGWLLNLSPVIIGTGLAGVILVFGTRQQEVEA